MRSKNRCTVYREEMHLALIPQLGGQANSAFRKGVHLYGGAFIDCKDVLIHKSPSVKFCIMWLQILDDDWLIYVLHDVHNLWKIFIYLFFFFLI